MTTYQIKIEQQIIPVPPEIGESDERVKQALAPFWPEAANAMITRTTEGETVTVNVVKKAGTKGAGRSPLEKLERCKGGVNPAVSLWQEVQGLAEMGEMDPEKLLALNGRIEKAIEDGRGQLRQVEKAAERLEKAAPQPAPVVPVGF